MTTKERQPELAVGDKVPDDFMQLRGASSMAYEEGIGIKYRRHFWYVTRSDHDNRADIVEHVCTSYTDAREKWLALVNAAFSAESETTI